MKDLINSQINTISTIIYQEYVFLIVLTKNVHSKQNYLWFILYYILKSVKKIK